MRTGSQGGFTLLEMLVTLALLALATGLMFPALQRTLPALALGEGEDALLCNLRIARAQAITAAGPVAFAVSQDGGGYGWTGAASRALPPGASARLLRPVLFYADGTASDGAIRLQAGGRGETIVLEPLTGAPRRAP